MVIYTRVNNRKNFVLDKVKSLHPASREYLPYWRRHKQRCVEGFWSIDDADITVDVNEDFPRELYDNHKGGWRYQPGNSYFYVNFGIILHKDDNSPKSQPKKKIRPLLRDTEWELFYNWIEARGFSGFLEDKKYTCDRRLIEEANFDLDVYRQAECVKENGEFNEEKFHYLAKPDGTLKEYVNAHDYLRKLHDRPMGRALYENNAKDLFWLACRGVGKSFSVAIGILLYEILFDGIKVYNEENRLNPPKAEVFLGAGIAAKSNDLAAKIKQGMDNLPGGYQDASTYESSPLAKTMSGSLKPNNQERPWQHLYKKKIGGTWVEAGSGSNIKHGIYTTENAEAAAGGRYSVMAVEEAGLVGNALTVHGSNTATMMDFPIKFGSAIWIGTGGNIEKIQEMEIMYRNPGGFEALEFDDVWEGSGKIGWFTPAYYGMNKFKDKNGNTDLEGALAYIEARRAEKSKAKDPSALALEMMNYPLKPSEIFLNAKNSIFPQADLKAHKAEVVANPHRYTDSYYHVDLRFNDKGNLTVKHLGQGSYKVETEWPVKSNKGREGCIEIYEMPKEDRDGQVFSNRYIMGTDTYDDDESNTSSLGSTFVFDLLTDRIVAEYTGRLGTKEFYEVTRKLNLFYKADHNYENNKKGLYTYYDQKKSTHLLCDTPSSLKDVANVKLNRIGNQSKGTTASKQINAYAIRLILDWLLTPAYGESNPEVLNLHKIRSIGLLNELINYNQAGNFDRVSALGMVMILREEKLKHFKAEKAKDSIKTLADDPFFDKHYSPGTGNKKFGLSF